MTEAAEFALVDDVVEKYNRYVNPGLARLLSFAGYGVELRAEGCSLFDHTGKEFLDCLGGYGVFSLGHRHPRLVAAAKRAIDIQPMGGKVFFSKPLADLAEKLAEITPSPLQFTFMCNSGTEAVEGALKAAKCYLGRPKVIATVGGFHGKTIGGLAATGREKYRAPFAPLVPEFHHVPFNDVDAMIAMIDESTAAVIVETVQGEGGIHVADREYLAAVRKRCTDVDALLILDEVQTGFARTGKMFGMDHYGIVPDIVTFAKALSGGIVPVGAFMGTPAVWERMFGENPLLHTSTFGGNPLACSVALEAIRVIEDEGLCDLAARRGERMRVGLSEVRTEFPDLLSDVRGIGLMIGVEFTMDDVGELAIAQMVRRGVVAAYTLNNRRVIRFEPPLIISDAQVDRAVEVFRESVVETQALLEAVKA